jgi:hypothetical protein
VKAALTPLAGRAPVFEKDTVEPARSEFLPEKWIGFADVEQAE